MERRRDVFQAIADPTRRGIIHLLAAKPLTVNAIADYFDSSRPTISEHVKILTECGLIIVKKIGRERHCEARLEQLAEVSGWVAQYKKYWNRTLDAMETYLNELDTKTNNNEKRKEPKRSNRK